MQVIVINERDEQAGAYADIADVPEALRKELHTYYRCVCIRAAA